MSKDKKKFEEEQEVPMVIPEGEDVEIDSLFEDYGGRKSGKKAVISLEKFELLVSKARAILDKDGKAKQIALEVVNKVLGTSVKNANGFAYALKSGAALVKDGEVYKVDGRLITTKDIMKQYDVYIGTFGRKGHDGGQGLIFQRGFTGQ
jgi:hypothetical protein